MSSGLRLSHAKRGLVALAVVLSALLARECAAQAAATPSATQEAAQLLRDGLCRDGAAKLNEGLAEKDPHAYFVAGFMFARGVCVAADAPDQLAAVSGFKRAGLGGPGLPVPAGQATYGPGDGSQPGSRPAGLAGAQS